MKKAFFLLVFIFIACNSSNTKNVKNVIIKGYSLNSEKLVPDTLIISPVLNDLIHEYLIDTTISKYDSIVKLLLVEFFCENGDTIMSISGHSVMPVIGPQNKSEGYEFKGFYCFNDIPVLVYDNKTAFGLKFYDEDKLNKWKLELEKCPDNLIALPSWMYKICSNGKVDPIKKRPMFLLKK